MKPITRIICLGAAILAGGSGAYKVAAQEGAPAAATAIALQAPVPAAATEAGNGSAASDIADWMPVSQETLDQTRGGFDMGNGLVASFGIDRAVYVNGNLVTSTSFNVPDIARITSTQAAAMSAALNSISLTQIGPNNIFNPSALGQTSAGTVIQNTLNNQNIQSITTLNASVNSLNAFRQANFQDALQQLQLQSLGH